MGCDIHSRIEVKKNGKWILNTEPLFKNPYEWRIKEDGEYLPHWPDGRHYDWFSILADVRNGSGFAGIKTGDGFIPIADPRGVPDDSTEEWAKYVEEWGGDMHSQSWLTLEDFETYDWNRETRKTGVIPLDEYKKLKGTNKSPESWSGSIGGGGIVTVSETQADEILKGKTVMVIDNSRMFSLPETHVVSLKTGHKIYVQHEWTVNYKEWFENKIKNEVEPLKKLKEKYEDVRVVFGFDN